MGPDRGEGALGEGLDVVAEAVRAPVVEQHQPRELGVPLRAHRGPAGIDEEPEAVAQPLLLSRHAGGVHGAEPGQQKVVELRPLPGCRGRPGHQRVDTWPVVRLGTSASRFTVPEAMSTPMPRASRMTTSSVRDRTLSPPALRSGRSRMRISAPTTNPAAMI